MNTSAGAGSSGDGTSPAPSSEVPGPRRCRKTGSARPLPADVTVRVLPPTDPEAWVPPQPLVTALAYFNEGEYRACVEPVEALFFARRNTLHQGLLQYVVALHQLRLGYVATPRRLLAQALELWRPYPEWQEGLDLAALRAHAAALRAALPEGVHSAQPEEISGWGLPAPPRLAPGARAAAETAVG